MVWPAAAAAALEILICGVAPSHAANLLQSPATDTRGPTPMEEALAEHSCGPAIASALGDARYQCISARLDELRARFGYDLKLLTPVERQNIDRTCGSLRSDTGDAYIACLSKALLALHAPKP